jgi:hypothetical protein
MAPPRRVLFCSLRSRCVGNNCNYRGNRICYRVFAYSPNLGTCVVNRYLAMVVFSDSTAGTMFTQPLAGNGRLLWLWYSAFSRHVTVFNFLHLKAIVDILSLIYDIYKHFPSILDCLMYDRHFVTTFVICWGFICEPVFRRATEFSVLTISRTYN